MAGFYEGADCNAAEDRAWGRDELPEHAQLGELLEQIATESDGGDALDELVDHVIDDTSDLRAWLKLAVSANDDAEVGRLMRNAVERYARRAVAGVS